MDRYENLLGTVAPIISLIIGVSFAISFVYNLGFYFGLDLNLSIVPLSVLDITNSTIKFSILSPIAIAVGMAISVKRKKILQTTTEAGEEENQNSRLLIKYIILFILLLILIFLYGFRVDLISIATMVLMFGCYKFIPSFISIFITFTILTMSVGFIHGNQSRDINKTNIKLSIDDDIISASLITNLSTGILCKIKGQIKFVPWENINSIEYETNPLYKGYLCKKYNICFKYI